MARQRTVTSAAGRSSSAQSGRSQGASVRSQSPSANGSTDRRQSLADTVSSYQRSYGQTGGTVHSTVEEESELRQFLKVVRPDWSCPRKHGHSDVNRVVEKLKSIGVCNTWQLMQRVNNNKINEDLLLAGKARFSAETMEAMRKQSSFVRALEHLKEPYVRQIGTFAPVPQLLSGMNLRLKAERKDGGSSAAGSRPSSEPGGRPASTSQSGSQEAFGSRPLDVDGSVGLGDVGGTLDLSDYDGRLAGLQASVCSSGGGSLVLDDSDGEPWAIAHPRVLYLRGARPRHKVQKFGQAPGMSYSLPDLSLQSVGAPRDGTPPLSAQTPDSPGSPASRTGSPSAQRPASRGPTPSGALRPQSVESSLACSSVFDGGGRSRCASPSGGLHPDLAAAAPGFPARRRASDSSTAVASTAGFNSSAGRERVAFKQDTESGASEMELEAQAEQWNREGAVMSKAPREARWASRCTDPEAALHQCEAMLEEQASLDERRRLERMMTNEGPQSPLRHYIVKNIRKLLLSEKERDHQGVLDTHQRATHIRKHLAHMQSKRRDLAVIKARAQEAVFGKQENKPTLGLSVESSLVEKFRRAKNRTTVFHPAPDSDDDEEEEGVPESTALFLKKLNSHLSQGGDDKSKSRRESMLSRASILRRGSTKSVAGGKLSRASTVQGQH